MDFVLDRLALGNVADAAAPSGVSALLCVAAELDAPSGVRVAFHKVPIIDFRPIPAAQLADAIEWIETQAARRVLVYCNAGVGRSTSVVVGYLCVACGMGFGQAIEFVARRRPHMSILPGLLTAIDRLRTRCP